MEVASDGESFEYNPDVGDVEEEATRQEEWGDWVQDQTSSEDSNGKTTCNYVNRLIDNGGAANGVNEMEDPMEKGSGSSQFSSAESLSQNSLAGSKHSENENGR